ncbi:MAG: ABC transporter substrate-binding protein [Lachnospiraceae bacterium]|nr:ABC transporter substrate-binding protein [Lachnospiraceae bacterium]
MRKKILGMFLAGVLAMTALTGCEGAANGNNGAGTQEQASGEEQTTGDQQTTAEPAGDGALTGTLNLGVIGPMTGAAALYGNAVKNGAEIAVEEINAIDPAFQIKLDVQDDVHDPEISVNAYQTLKDNNVQVIVGTVTTSPCLAVSAEANSDRVFMLTPSASSPSVTEGKDNVFQLCFSDPNQGSASAQYIADNKLASKVAVIYNNGDAYSTGIYQTFKSKASELGLELVSETTFTDDTATDFTVQLKAAQDAGAELLFLPIYYQPASLILKQASDMGFAPKMFGVDGMDGILTMEGFDTKLAEGVILLTPFSADAEDEATANFVKKYNDKVGETPSQFAADGYDCPYAIYRALEFYAAQNGGLDVTDMSYADLCEILIGVFTNPDFSVDGITGQGMVWGANGEVNKAPKAVVIENGVYVGM